MKGRDGMDNDNDNSFYMCQTLQQVCYVNNLI